MKLPKLCLLVALTCSSACTVSESATNLREGEGGGEISTTTGSSPGSSQGGTGGEGGTLPDEPEPGSVRYPTIDALHEKAIVTTCSLNNGVCHSSKEYPDLHTLATLMHSIGRDCGATTADREDILDACEPKGDRLVIPAANLDAEIVRVELIPADAPTSFELTDVIIHLASDLPSPVEPYTGGIEVRRGATTFVISDIEPDYNGYGGAYVTESNQALQTVTLKLLSAQTTVKSFFDDRVYPWSDLMVRVADPNGNGVFGESDGPLKLIQPGDPMQSYLVRRLWDPTFGDLMPRQCRTWDDQATRALGCWIAGLEVDATGVIKNAAAPIDYEACEFQVPSAGKCGTGSEPEAIFARSCGGSGCHIGEEKPAAGLDLSTGKARDSLVGVASTQDASRLRVDVDSPESSYLLCKIRPDCQARLGARMPSPGGSGSFTPLPEEDIEALRSWIAAGAKPSE